MTSQVNENFIFTNNFWIKVCYHDCLIYYKRSFILWHICPTQELFSAENSKCDCATAVRDIFPSPCFAPHIARRCCKHWITQQYTTPCFQHVRFRVYRIDWRQFSLVQYKLVSSQVRVRNREFKAVRNQIQRQLLKWVIGVSCEECFCE
jgi:hypothetical protein